MKIMSLNVNRFSGMEERDYTDLLTSLDKCPKANEIITLVKVFLYENPDGVVFLQEVPHWRGYGQYPKLLQCIEGTIRHFLQNRKAESCTVAIVKKKSGWEQSNEFSEKRKRTHNNISPYENKFVEVKHAKLNFQFLGVHSPWQRKKELNDITEFFDALEDYAKEKTDQRFIIVGDLNADTDTFSTYHETLENIQRMKYKLAVVELGDVITNFKDETRIDHVVVSPELTNSVTVQVIPREILELSDHAVIIVTIDE